MLVPITLSCKIPKDSFMHLDLTSKDNLDLEAQMTEKNLFSFMLFFLVVKRILKPAFLLIL